MQPTAVALAVAALLFVLHQFLLRSGGRSWPAPVAALAVVAFMADVLVAAIGARRPLVTASLGVDATVGRPATATLDVGRPPARRVAVALASLPSQRAELDIPGVAHVEFVPGARGVIRHALVEVTVEGPLGLARAIRALEVAVPEALHVAPAPLELPDLPVPPSAAADAGRGRADPKGDLTRGVREWRPGDPWRLAHWPATARQGRLMARELEQPAAEVAAVVVELGPLEGADAERAAAYAAHAVAVLLERGVTVELTTLEATGVRRAPVATRRELGRRLAAAVAGAPLPRPGRRALRLGPDGWALEPGPDGRVAPAGQGAGGLR